ncbi:MAG: glyoxalase [bacterium]|nr:glyoxalase [bacterium]
MRPLFVLYVSDQARAREFYHAVLQMEPSLDVPGMTEFPLGDSALLGLMPAAGIKRLLGELLPDPASASGVPRAELYLMVASAQPYIDRALINGARQLSPLHARDWGHAVAYFLDPDNHVLAIAEVPGG